MENLRKSGKTYITQPILLINNGLQGVCLSFFKVETYTQTIIQRALAAIITHILLIISLFHNSIHHGNILFLRAKQSVSSGETKCFQCANNTETISRRARLTADSSRKSASGVCLASKKMQTYTL